MAAIVEPQSWTGINSAIAATSVWLGGAMVIAGVRLVVVYGAGARVIPART